MQFEEIDYLEVHASGILNEDQAERIGLGLAFQSRKAKVPVGSVKTNLGHLYGASGIMSLIKSALCLYGRYVPASSSYLKNKQIFDDRFELLAQSQTQQNMRYISYSSLGADHNYVHVILEAVDNVIDESLDTRTLAWEKEYSQGLLKKIWVAGEKTFAESILDQSHLDRFQQARARHRQHVFNHQQDQSNIKLGNFENHLESHFSSHASGLSKQASFVQRNIQTHLSYLKTQEVILKKLSQLLCLQEVASKRYHLQFDTTGLEEAYGEFLGQRPSPTPIRFQVSSRSNQALMNERELRELTDGQVAKVLGEQYAQADQYMIRTRMPSMPFNFVSRITKLTAAFGALKPCEIEWEYDIPIDAWYVSGDQVPTFVSLESSHAMIVAFTVIGCDQMFKGELSYRAVNSHTKIYSGFPKAGDILKGRVEITSFKRMGGNILIDYVYQCSVGDRLCFELRASSGFFNRADINASKGMNTKAVFARATREKKPPLLDSMTDKKRFNFQEIQNFGRGHFSQCFEVHYSDLPNPVFRPSIQMLDQVLEIDPTGGAWGLGFAMGEVTILPDHWAFQAHFKNDPCLPGTLIVEGCEQILKFYVSYLGFNTIKSLKHHWVRDISSTAKFRGEVRCKPSKIQYRFSVKDFQVVREAEIIQSMMINSVIEVLYEDKIIGLCDDMTALYQIDELNRQGQFERHIAQA